MTNATWTQTVVPNISAAKVAPAVGVGVNCVVKGGSTPPPSSAPSPCALLLQSTGSNPTPTAPVEDACQIKFADWPVSGTAITNAGIAGASYNGVSSVNSTVTEPSGATAWVSVSDTKSVYIPHGSVIDNPTIFTLEIMVYFAGYATQGHSDLFVKVNGFDLYLSNYGAAIYIYRVTTDGSRYCSCGLTAATSGTAVQGSFYIQLAWDSTNMANTPTLKINNIAMSVGGWVVSGSSTSWKDDSAANAFIVNQSVGGTSDKNATVYLFRWHSRILSSAEMTTNWNADRWRWKQGFVTPAIGKTQTVVPDVSHAAAKPSIDIGVSPVSPNILAQTLQPALDIGSRQTVVPDIRAQTSAAPTIGIGVTPTVPDIRVQKVSPAVDLAITQQTVPDIRSRAIPPTIALAIIQHLTPYIRWFG